MNIQYIKRNNIPIELTAQDFCNEYAQKRNDVNCWWKIDIFIIVSNKIAHLFFAQENLL